MANKCPPMFSNPIWDTEDLKMSKFFSVIFSGLASLQVQDQYKNNQLLCWNTFVNMEILYVTRNKISDVFLSFGDPVYE